MIILLIALVLVISNAADDFPAASLTVRLDRHADSNEDSSANPRSLPAESRPSGAGDDNTSELRVGEPISNGCADMDQALFTTGMTCGSPLSPPCFDHSRKRAGDDNTSELRVGEPISNGCADMDQALFTTGMTCGSPLSPPCFDHSRCLPPPDGQGPTIYVHDGDCSLADSSDLTSVATNSRRVQDHPGTAWREAAKEAGVLAETYESACAFIQVNPKSNHPCPVDTPLWNDGANHLMVDFGDISRAERPEVARSYAMEAASNVHTCYYRSGYDMSLPLFPHTVFPEMEPIPPEDRRFLVTVKASVYLYGHGSEERMSLVPLHDEPNGVIMALHCFEMHDEHLFPENVDYCKELHDRYDNYDYESLMNTTFGVVPGGRSPGSFRLAEVMSSGAIPVFVGRDLVPPFREQFDWESFSFMFSPDEVGPSMVKTLQSVPPEKLREMQKKSLNAYWKIFGGTTNSFEKIARKVVDLLVQRIAYYH